MQYNGMIGHIQVHPAFRSLRASKCQPKHKVFVWLLIKDELINSRGMLNKKKHETTIRWMGASLVPFSASMCAGAILLVCIDC
jgi:hypothetical protein